MKTMFIFKHLLTVILFLVVSANGSMWNELFNYFNSFFSKCNPSDLNSTLDLREDLDKRVFGQPLVKDIIVNAMQNHVYKTVPTKPLALSFHGWTGSGKNYVSDFIVKHRFFAGYKNPNVHVFVAKIHFPSQHKVNTYQIELRDKIMDSVRNCQHSIFIFDEVEKFPAGVLDIVKPFLDYKVLINGVDYRHAIFIFISNIGANLIVDRTLELWRSGKQREEFQLRDFENLLTIESFNEKGGFYKSDIIDSHLIDHFVPFLPLEKEHVALCILVELLKYSFSEDNIESQIVEEVIGDMQFGPEPEDLFSVAGCKRVSQLVGRLAMKYGLKILRLPDEPSSFSTFNREL